MGPKVLSNGTDWLVCGDRRERGNDPVLGGFVLRLVARRPDVKAEEVGPDGGKVDLHDAKPFVELSDVVAQATDFLAHLLAQLASHRVHLVAQLGSHRVHLVAKAMNVVTEA